ncbi:AraC family transcriptional regulator [Pelagibacterium lentulum]|uniref:AraC family transcriptional regulator n=1 Tax=Pelagibacterium lentulum TaxID=2029865 RepID=A0A916R6V7_9HYPH|nr:AraC family transcriptional regulator [Pelagibacterium lentulum]GGA38780.1 AraC family transcriptional regulator [Pelagibacterium lentulum]
MLSNLIAYRHDMRLITPGKQGPGLACMASGAGYELRVNEIYSWDGLKRGAAPFALIQHTLDGEGRLDFAGQRHRLEPGDTMLLTFPHANRYWLERGKSWEYFWITLSGREALRLAGAILSARGPVLRADTETVDTMAGSCLFLLEGTAEKPGSISAAAYSAIAALYDAAFAQSEPPVSLPPAILRVTQFIDANLAGRLDIERLAQVAGLSRAHFVRTFTVSVGQAPSDHVFERRIDRAMRLLVATDTPVHAIAQACGFADANYFAKAFRRARGVSPGTFRQTERMERQIDL